MLQEKKAQVCRMKKPPKIEIYRFEDAPQDLQDMSTNGGDEDWIAIVPYELMRYHQGDFDDWALPMFLLSFSPFGCCKVEFHNHPTRKNCVIAIGCHA